VKTTDEMTVEERIAVFGYDPKAKLKYIGTSNIVQYESRNHKFDFYYNASTKKIEVCYEGYNGTSFWGMEISDTETTLPPELSNAFFEVKKIKFSE
jgi:hypothetical protein